MTPSQTFSFFPWVLFLELKNWIYFFFFSVLQSLPKGQASFERRISTLFRSRHFRARKLCVRRVAKSGFIDVFDIYEGKDLYIYSFPLMISCKKSTFIIQQIFLTWVGPIKRFRNKYPEKYMRSLDFVIQDCFSELLAVRRQMGKIIKTLPDAERSSSFTAFRDPVF